MKSPEDEVLDALRRHTNLCAGADTCIAREIIEPLVAEVERLRKALHSIAYSDTEAYSPNACALRNRAYYALRNAL